MCILPTTGPARPMITLKSATIATASPVRQPVSRQSVSQSVSLVSSLVIVIQSRVSQPEA